jgi:hypothetical protein
MSNTNKIHWLMVIVFGLLVACMSYLVALSLISNGTGLECVYNCDSYPVMIESLK